MFKRLILSLTAGMLALSFATTGFAREVGSASAALRAQCGGLRGSAYRQCLTRLQQTGVTAKKEKKATQSQKSAAKKKQQNAPQKKKKSGRPRAAVDRKASPRASMPAKSTRAIRSEAVRRSVSITRACRTLPAGEQEACLRTD